MKKFRKGQKVLRKLVGVCGTYVESKAKVSRVDKRGVWLSNGRGKKSSGPFHPRTGRYPERKRIFSMRQMISPLPQRVR